MLLTLRLCLFTLALCLPVTNVHATTVSFINPSSPSNPFWSAVTRNMRDAAKDLDIRLRIVYTNGSRLQMISGVKNELQSANKPDYLILVNQAYALGKMLNMAEVAGVKTFTFMNPLHPNQARPRFTPRNHEFSQWLGMLIPDNVSSLRDSLNNQLECIRRQQPEAETPFHLLALLGSPGNPASRIRESALQHTVARAEDIALDRALFTQWNQQRSQNLTESYLNWSKRNRVRPALIWTENNMMAASVIKALRAKGLEPGRDICLASMDVSSAGLNMLEKGLLSSLTTGHTYLGAVTLAMLHDHAKGLDFAGTDNSFTTRVKLIQLTPEDAPAYRSRMRAKKWRFDYRSFSRIYQPDVDYAQLLKRLYLQQHAGVNN